MITLIRYNLPTNENSLKVEVTPSIITQNRKFNTRVVDEIAIDMHYKNYIVEEDGVSTQKHVSFMFPFDFWLSFDSIFELTWDFLDDYLDELDVVDVARPTVIDAVARCYFGIKKTLIQSGLAFDAPSRLLELGMSVLVEVDVFNEAVQGLTMDLDEDYNNNNNNNNGCNRDYGREVKEEEDEIRAYLGRCGVRFSMVDEARCAICLETVVTGAEVARLPCCHVFHGDCVVEMVVKGSSSHHACPLCRSELNCVQP